MRMELVEKNCHATAKLPRCLRVVLEEAKYERIDAQDDVRG